MMDKRLGLIVKIQTLMHKGYTKKWISEFLKISEDEIDHLLSVKVD